MVSNELLCIAELKSMVFNRFVILVVLRIVVLIVTIFAFSGLVILYNDRPVFFIGLLLLLMIILEITDLIYFVLHTNRQVTKFLSSLRSADFTIRFSGIGLERSFKELADAMNQTVEMLRQLRLEKETQIHLLKIITADIKTGIISVNSSGWIVLMNQHAQNLLNLPGEVKSWGELRALRPAFAKETDMIHDDGKTFADIKIGKEIRKVSLNSNTIPLLDEKIRIITFEDIQNQIELKETDAWLKLTRIIMHEIMNSVTPLSSLTETMGNILINSIKADNSTSFTREDLDDIKFCIENIKTRKKHLVSFVENYRRLMHLPDPVKKRLNAFKVVNAVNYCLKAELKHENIDLFIDPDLHKTDLWADESQVEQVLINLITNSIHAVHDSEIKRIEIRVLQKDHHIILQVSDTGSGIPPEKLNDIFIPFYTTKQNGSGIGLGISRQIMLAHNGSIRVQSEPGEGSTFSLWFPKP